MNREFWNAAGEAAREQPLKAKDKDAAWFAYGAEWALAGMAVCEFLADLAGIVAESNACPVCDAGWVRPNTFGGMERLCNTCRGTGKRVTP